MLSLKNKPHLEEQTTQVWREFEKGKEYFNRTGLVDNVQKANRFYEGNHWAGAQTGDDVLPIFNVITPIVDYKSAMVAMNEMSITYSSMNFGQAYDQLEQVARALTHYAARQWEKQKMSTKAWECVKRACIDGDSYLYFYDDNIHSQIISSANIMLADETNRDLQQQAYILIFERKFVSDVIKEATQNGISKKEIENIVADSDEGADINDDDVARDKKCSCILKFEKRDGKVFFSKSTKTVVYQQPTEIEGLEVYPIANFVWKPRKDSARGVGEVVPLIANQISINKNIARRLLNSKLTAYAKLVVADGKVANPEALEQVGSTIYLHDHDARNINSMIGYLNPAPVSSDARNLTDELIVRTRELANASDAATGIVDPTKASGAAIIAVRDQASIPLNEQTAHFKQFIEDIALIWYSMWVTYHPNGFALTFARDGQQYQAVISPKELQELKVDIKVDISPSDPFSRYAREQAVERLYQMNALSFEEYVALLDEMSNVPKGKLQAIIDKRAAQIAVQSTPPLQGDGQSEAMGGQQQALAQSVAQNIAMPASV